jgi:hypothetical protein
MAIATPKCVRGLPRDPARMYNGDVAMREPAHILPLAYASPAATAADDPHRSLLTGATACGVIPLCLGFGVLFGFLATRDEGLAFLGLGTIAFGLLLFVMGLLFLLRYFWETTRLPPSLRRPHYIAIGMRLLLLAFNFPAALLCIYIAVHA